MLPKIEEVLKELPAYLGHFTHMLTQPTQLVTDHLQATEPKSKLEQSIAFLLLSLVIAAILAFVFPEVTNPLKLISDETGMVAHALTAIRLLFILLGLAGLAYLAARIAGVRSGFQRFFGLTCAATGIILVLQVFAASLTNISMADPVTAKGWIAMEKGMAELKPLIQQGVLCQTQDSRGEITPDSKLGKELQIRLAALQNIYQQATDRPLFKLSVGLQWLALAVLMVWSASLWGTYLNSHTLTTGKSVLATGLLVVFTGAGGLLYMLVTTGADIMALYRQCGQG